MASSELGGAGEYGYALRVLRLPTSAAAAAESRPLERPLPALQKAMELADLEYERLMSTIDPVYYHEFAVPATVEIGREVAEKLRSLLGLKEDFPGVLGPSRVRLGEKHYKVWVQLFPCG